MTRLAAPLLALGLVAGCGDDLDPKKKAVCERAADRWEACVKEMFGPEMANQSAQKRDIGACARDDRTVAMYEACLPKATCDELLDCLMATVE